MNTPNRQKTGKSVLELLAVLALFACLIGLLLPAVHAVRIAANRTNCLNNLRQIGLGVQGFRGANQDRHPEPNWPENIAPHIDGCGSVPILKLFLCPADVRFELPDGSVAGSYGMSGKLLGRTTPIPDGDSNTVSHSELTGTRLNVRFDWGAEIGDIAPEFGPHSSSETQAKGVSVLFADGHVRILHADRTTREFLDSLIDPADGLPITVE